MPFKGVSGYVNVPVKSYQARVTPAGAKTVAIDSKRIPTWNSMIRTVVAVDNPGGATPFTFLFLEDRN